MNNKIVAPKRCPDDAIEPEIPEYIRILQRLKKEVKEEVESQLKAFREGH